MERSDVINFFDTLAPAWDAEMIRNDEIINIILDCGKVSAGKRVLDVACGTGVLFPDYLNRSVKCVVGVDISPEMAKIAAEKHDDARVKVICADVQELEFDEKFDCVMIYNAFPHFPEPSKLLAYLDGLGIGDVGNVVLKDRKLLSEDGLIIVGATIDEATGTLVAGPDVVSRGFVYVKESESLITETVMLAQKVLDDCLNGDIMDLHIIKLKICGALSALLYEKTGRRPMILPIIMKIQ